MRRAGMGMAMLGYAIGRFFVFILIEKAVILFGAWLAYMGLKLFNYI